MKTTDKKHEFINLRARGLSYDNIAKELHVSKATLIKWAREYEAEISDLTRENLDSLYESYGMAKEARIKALGGTLEKINAAIDAADFTKIPPSTLLRLKLDYQNALKDEYTPVYEEGYINTPEDVKNALNRVLEACRRGDMSQEQLSKELAAIRAIQSAITDIDIRKKIDELEQMLTPYTGEI